jgi:hypothetical protein
LTDYIFLNPLDPPLENNDFMFEKSCSYQCNFNAKETSIMQKEIQKLLKVLIEVKNDEEQFLSPILGKQVN